NNGRFLSQDPAFLAVGDQGQVAQLSKHDQRQLLSDPQSLNSYGYARSNPVKNVDPDGQFSMPVQQYWNSYGQAWRGGLQDSWSGILQGFNNLVTFSKAVTDATSQWQVSHPNEANALATLVGGVDFLPEEGKLSISGIANKYNWGRSETLEDHFARH